MNQSSNTSKTTPAPCRDAAARAGSSENIADSGSRCLASSVACLRLIFLLAAIVGAALQTGCAVYSIRGTHSSDLLGVQTANGPKYRLASYTVEFSQDWFLATPAHYARFGLTQLDVERTLIEKNPLRFTRGFVPDAKDGSAAAIPLNVHLRTVNSTSDCAPGLAIYFISLGILPGKIHSFEDTFDVEVRTGEATSQRVARGGVGYRSNLWLSCYTPLALLCSDSADNYRDRGLHKEGRGGVADTKADSEYIFLGALSNEINALIDRLEMSASLRR
jgi:hypothetical protein